MTKLAQEEKEKILKRVFWDVDIDEEKMSALLTGPLDLNDRQTKILYARLLKSLPWYTLLKLLGKDKLLKILNDQILSLIHPPALKEKYAYARKVLSK